MQTEQMPKKRLSDSLRAGLHIKGLTVSAAAAALKEHRTNVHAWLDRNSFPSSAVLPLAKVAGVEAQTVDELKAKFEFEVYPSRGRRPPTVSTNPTVIDSLFGVQGSSACAVRILSTEAPEWNPVFWTTSEGGRLLDALRRGVRIGYVVPEDREYARWSDSYDTRALPSPSEMEQAFKRFVRIVSVESPEAEKGLGLLRAPSGPFFLPFAVLTLSIQEPAGDAASEAAVVGATLECQSGSDEELTRPLQVPLPGAYARQIARFVRNTADRVAPATPFSSFLVRTLARELRSVPAAK